MCQCQSSFDTSGKKTSATVNQKLCDRNARKYVGFIRAEASSIITFQ